jgi:hypothetical protein
MVDATFSINDKVRKVQDISYCAGEPFKKDHIIIQNNHKKKSSFKYVLKLTSGYYRARIVGNLNAELVFSADRLACEISNTSGEILIKKINNNEIEFLVHNRSSKNEIFVLEEYRTSKNYLAPMKVFSSPIFRNYFSDQAIGHGVQLKVPEQIILFTDIVKSTKFYKKHGDCEAFMKVQKHFNIIYRLLSKYNGLLVKTIGDAVMASFSEVDDVVSFCKEVNTAISNDDEINFELRYSAHKGNMIAVNNNKGIDFFGNNVNIAAKLQEVANANELSLSLEIAQEVVGVSQIDLLEHRLFCGNEIGYVFCLNNKHNETTQYKNLIVEESNIYINEVVAS